jgi:outer membrane receptor protein involved in Fe transport
MLSLRTLVGAVAALALAVVSPAAAHAQGVTTGALTGTITDDAGQGVEGAQVQLRNARTGLNIGTLSRSSGLYSIQGISPNNDYTIVVRRIGYGPQTRTGVVISLGQTRREDFKLTREAAVLSTVTVTATTDPVINASKTGATTTISDSALSRLPTLNRNFSDFVQLVPQVSTSGGVGLSGAGVNLRQNAIQIDGAQSGDIFGLGTSGQPGSQANAKSIPLDAVKEYQVLLSPFDVRQGNFGGLLINAVTKSGTNEYRGSIYGYTRNQSLTRTQSYLTDYTQQQYGGTFGGPILRDKLFFFASGEIQRRQTPTTGSYIGDPNQYVSQASIDDIAQRVAVFGLAEPGTGEQLQIQNPNRNFFGRIDANLPLSTRLVLRHNYAAADRTSFGRGSYTSANPNFGLTSNKYEFSSTTNSTVAEFLSNLPSSMFNELLLNYSTTKDFRTVPVRFPQLTVRGITRTDNPAQTANFVLGTESSSQGNSLDQTTFELTDNLTIPVGNHSLTLGTKNLFYQSVNLFSNNSLGNWTFASPAALSAGTATSYIISAPAPTDPYNGLATIRANTYGVYVQDVWTYSPTLTFTAGLRYDKPDFRNVPPENDIVFTQYDRHTSSVPTKGQFSPRVGFNWDVTGDQVNQLRGGIGSFAGSVPFVYLSNAFGNSGLSGFSSLTCNNVTANTNLAPPVFSTASAANPPQACDLMTASVRTVGGGATIVGPASGAAVATIDPDFKYPKYLKASLGFDRRLSNGVIATLEGLYSRSQNNAFYQNLALVGPYDTLTGVFRTDRTDRNGRILYGRLLAAGATADTKGNRTQVLDVTNASGDYTYSITGQLQKSFTDNFEGSAAYTFMRARDVVSTTSSTQGSNYRYQRSVSGFLDDLTVTKSKYDQPHRIIATGTYRFPTLTDVSVIYTGNSGSPYDYVYGSTGGTTGDLNADGQSQQDLLYVPTDARDQNQILFQGYNGTAPGKTSAQAIADAAAMANAFENFINDTPCLNEARGTILTRNACRNPWVNQFDVSFAQTLSAKRFQSLQVRLDIINFGNLLNRNWGKQAFSDQGSTCGAICSATIALSHTGFALPAGTPAGGNSPNAQGIFTFDPTFRAFSSDNISSNYTMQLSMRYSF